MEELKKALQGLDVAVKTIETVANVKIVITFKKPKQS